VLHRRTRAIQPSTKPFCFGGIFFSKAALVTFGGAYAVLPYVAQQAVQTHRWLSASQMLDGLGLAETTPGPLIMVTQFVGLLIINVIRTGFAGDDDAEGTLVWWQRLAILGVASCCYLSSTVHNISQWRGKFRLRDPWRKRTMSLWNNRFATKYPAP
jgi:hypothetical protein